ncbi:MAG TPA: hypothetical protein VI306_21155 [Pyrinomonadaceae bacterium]
MKEARIPHSGAVPNSHQAKVPAEKLTQYLLEPLHLEGRNKARVFKSALGFEQSDSAELAAAILAELPYYPVISSTEGVWGRKYEVVLPITGKNKRVVDVMTVWIVRRETDFPSLVTSYVMKGQGE